MKNSKPSLREQSEFAAGELVVRRKARADILAYVDAIDVPGRPANDDPDTEQFEAVPTPLAAHHRLILERAEATSLTPHGRLMIFTPPGSGKSTYASVVFPSRYLGAAPDRRLILASYGDALASRMGRRTRSIIRQKRYEQIWHTRLTADSHAAHAFALDNGSEYLACGILAGVTGNRADCLRAGTMIHTRLGPVPIQNLYDMGFDGDVLSYEHGTGRVVYRRVEAMARRETPDFYRVVSHAGAMVEATGNHRFWTTRGWVEARFLAKGDRLVRMVPGTASTSSVCADQGHAQKSEGGLLQSRVPSKRHESGARAPAAPLSDLRENRNFQEPSLLFSCLPSEGRGLAAGPRSRTLVDSSTGMRGLQSVIQAEKFESAGALLLARMQGSWTRDADARAGQSGLASWTISRTGRSTRRTLIPRRAQPYPAARWQPLRRLRIARTTSGPSHRSESDEQPLEQPRYAVQTLSRTVARGRALETETDTVAVVERVCEPVVVYDMQVADTRCFFANGILVHNCVVIDDPMRGREQASSELIRDKIWDAYENDLKTRLSPGGSIILIQTRWHEDDLAGRILPVDWNGESGPIACRDGNTWEVLCLQARCETDSDPLGRAKGEYLWPEWFTQKHWAQFEASPRTWASLYQQRPAPSEGDLFRPDELHIVDILPAGGIEWARGWDLASIEGDGDYTVGAKLGRLPDGRFVIADIVRGRWGPDRRDAIIAGTANLDTTRARISLPQDPGQAGRTQVLYLSRQLAGYRVTSSPETGDKITRAEPFAAQLNAGNVLMMRADWNAALVAELRAFPYGTHDDQVDALSRAFAQLINRRPLRISDAALAAV